MRALFLGMIVMCGCTWDDAKFGAKYQRELARISALCDAGADTDPGLHNPPGSSVVCANFAPAKSYDCIQKLRRIKSCPKDDDFVPSVCLRACTGPEVGEDTGG